MSYFGYKNGYGAGKLMGYAGAGQAGGGGGAGGASAIPAATAYRLTAYETISSSIADISEVWLGSDSETRFASAVTTAKSTGGTSAGIVDGSLTDTGNSQNIGDGCWWELDYANAETLAYVQVARPNSTSGRRLETWAVRLHDETLEQWLTALVRGDTDDMSSAATYIPFDLAGEKIIVRPLMGEVAGDGGWATVEAAVAGGAALSVNRPSYVEANDAILLIWGNSGSGAAEYPITPPAGLVDIYDDGGLYVGLRITDAHASEPGTYAATNADGSLRSMAATARTLHNVDPNDPVGDVEVATATKTPSSITAASHQAVLIVALYGVNEANITPPDGYTLIGDYGRAAGAGNLRIVSAIRAEQDSGTVQPGDWGSTATPLRVITATINASTP